MTDMQFYLGVLAFILGPLFTVWLTSLRKAREEGGYGQRIASVEGKLNEIEADLHGAGEGRHSDTQRLTTLERDVVALTASVNELKAQTQRFEEASLAERRRLSEKLTEIATQQKMQHEATAKTLSSLEHRIEAALAMIGNMARRETPV